MHRYISLPEHVLKARQARISEKFGGELVNEKGLLKNHAKLHTSL